MTARDPGAEAILRVLVAMRRIGVSVRTMAKFAGVSKSTMGRRLPAIEMLMSQTGHKAASSPSNPKVSTADLSHVGHDGDAEPAP